jgi:AcrR family transcriptional regulator
MADVALAMFMERGYDAVTMADIATRAEVSISTLFNYFPTKEALVFDRAADIEEAIGAAIRERPAGMPILAAFKAFLRRLPAFRKPMPKPLAAFQRFVRAHPALVDYERRLFQRYEAALVEVIRAEADVDRLEAEAVTALAFDAYLRAKAASAPGPMLDRLFEVLERGWPR